MKIEEPFSSNVIPHVSSEARAMLLVRDATLDDSKHELVVPIVVGKTAAE